jgi:hypothetical protein
MGAPMTGTTPVNQPTSAGRTRSTRLLPLILAVAAAVIIAAVAFGANGFGGNDTPEPTDKPVPSGSPKPTPTLAPTPEPTNAPTPNPTPQVIPITLETADGHRIDLDIVDNSGKVLRAHTEKARSGASIEWGTVKVENVDAETLRFTWTNTPGSGKMFMTIDAEAGLFVLVQQKYEGDSIATDRFVEITFDGPISADDIEVSLTTANNVDA